MKKFFPLLLFAIFSASFLQAQQPSFNIWRLIPTGPGNAEKIVDIGNNEYLMIGKNRGFAFAMKVNKGGVSQRFVRYNGNPIGGDRSQFTDVVVLNDGYMFVGDCDNCAANDPGRRLLLVKTDKQFNIKATRKWATPTNIPRNHRYWGYARIRKNPNTNIDFIVSSQLVYDSTGGTENLYTDFALTKFDTGFVRDYHTAYDLRPADNLGDMEVNNTDVVLLNWSAYSATLGTDTTQIYRFNWDGDKMFEKEIPGIGASLEFAANGGYYIGGLEATDLVNGPQAMLMRTDASGNVLQRRAFGSTLIDAVRDLKVLSNGNLLVAVARDMAYPNVGDSPDLISLYAYPEDWPWPKKAEVARFDPNTLLQIGTANSFPNNAGAPILIRSVVPTNATGTTFVSTGAYYRKPLFYAYGPISREGIIVDEFSGDVAERGEISTDNMTMYPNPVLENGVLTATNVKADGVLAIEIYDMTGRMVSREEVPANETIQFDAPAESGLYQVRLYENGENIQNELLQVIR